MTMAAMGPFPPSFLLRALERASQEQAIHDGIAAMVRAYYENYTDATELEVRFTDALDLLAGLLDLDQEDLYRVVLAAEKSINDAGGIVGSDNKSHPVGPTFEIEED